MKKKQLIQFILIFIFLLPGLYIYTLTINDKTDILKPVNLSDISPTSENIVLYILGKINLSPDEKAKLDINNDTKVDAGDLVKAIILNYQPTPTPTPIPTNTPILSPTPSPTPPGVIETEPNDTEATAQYIGILNIGSSIRVTGRLSSGGYTSNTYTGDKDVFSFDIPVQQDVTFLVEWTADADIDLVLIYKGIIMSHIAGTEKPINVKGTLNPEKFSVAIVSKNNAADYNLTLTGSASSATYPNDNSLLNGKYQYFGVTAYWDWYLFDGVNKYEFWQWTAPSGDRLSHSGTYQIWYPVLILYHSDGEVEFHTLGFAGGNITLDGTTYYKQ